MPVIYEYDRDAEEHHVEQFVFEYEKDYNIPPPTTTTKPTNDANDDDDTARRDNGSPSVPVDLDDYCNKDIDDYVIGEGSLPHVEELRMGHNAAAAEPIQDDENYSNGSHGKKYKSIIRKYKSAYSNASKRTRMLVLAGILAVLAGLVTVSVIVRRNNLLEEESTDDSYDDYYDDSTDDQDASDSGLNPLLLSPQLLGRNTNYKDVIEFLSNNGVSLMEDLVDEGSYQYQAANWIANQDGANLMVPEESIEDQSGYLFMARYVMALNYFALGGYVQWKEKLNFLTHLSICDWSRQSGISNPGFIDEVKESTNENVFFEAGVICKSDVPVHLVLTNNNLIGSLPSENGLLTTLTLLKLERNTLTGSIPTELCQLTGLADVYLDSNQLSNDIPACIGQQLKSLQTLSLHRNRLTGSIPIEFSNSLDELENLSLSHNLLTGEPALIFNTFPKLKSLLASNNGFIGSVDSNFMSSTKQLEILDMSGNQLTSQDMLPEHLFNEMPSLLILDLSKNRLHGSMPQNIKTNAALKYLSLYDNMLQGNITDEIFDLKVLDHLDLSNNQFGGTIPNEIGTMSTLNFLSLGKNELLEPAPIPDSVSMLTSLTYLSLRATNRISKMPLLRELTNLLYLDLSYNKLEGPLPLNFYAMSGLEVLMLNSNNGITGVVMEAIGKWNDIHVAMFDGMNLTGSLEPICPLISPEKHETIYADCGGENPTVQCSCCECCESGTSGCSQEKIADLDQRLEYVYKMSDYSASISDVVDPNFHGLRCIRDGICN